MTILSQERILFTIYVDEDSITCKYTREDDIVYGYTFYIEGVCVDPRLVRMFEENKRTADKRPGLYHEQPLGRARNGAIEIAIRDTGTFMDPRSDKDWWK